MRRLLLASAALLLACAGTREARKDGAAPQAQAGAPADWGAGETLVEVDLNQDGRIDLWKFSRRGADGKEHLVRKESDLNDDGRVDAWEYYDAEGELVKQVYDMDFDGKPDLVLELEKGQLVRKAYGFGFDGKPHVWNYYEKGKLVRRERDTKGNGKVDYWEYWENGEIDRIGVDLDGDGQVDQWESRKAAAHAAK